MKKILFITMLFCSLMYSQNIYFGEPTSTHVDYIGMSGEGPIVYSMYAANGWYIYHFWARGNVWSRRGKFWSQRI